MTLEEYNILELKKKLEKKLNQDIQAQDKYLDLLLNFEKDCKKDKLQSIAITENFIQSLIAYFKIKKSDIYTDKNLAKLKNIEAEYKKIAYRIKALKGILAYIDLESLGTNIRFFYAIKRLLKEIIDKNLCLEDATIIFGLLVKYLPNNYYLIKQYFNSDGELIKFSVSSILKDQLLKVENTLSLEHFQYMETFELLASTILENYDKLLNQEEKGYKSIKVKAKKINKKEITTQIALDSLSKKWEYFLINMGDKHLIFSFFLELLDDTEASIIEFNASGEKTSILYECIEFLKSHIDLCQTDDTVKKIIFIITDIILIEEKLNDNVNTNYREYLMNELDLLYTLLTNLIKSLKKDDLSLTRKSVVK